MRFKEDFLKFQRQVNRVWTKRFVSEDKTERESHNQSPPHLSNSTSLLPKVKSTRPTSLHLTTDTPISLYHHESQSYSIQTTSLDFVAILDQFTPLNRSLILSRVIRLRPLDSTSTRPPVLKIRRQTRPQEANR